MTERVFICWIAPLMADAPRGVVCYGRVDEDLKRRALYSIEVPPYALERIVADPDETLAEAILRTFPYEAQRAVERAA